MLHKKLQNAIQNGPSFLQTGRQTNILWPDTTSASQAKIYSPMISCIQSLIQCPTNSTLIPPELITLFSSCLYAQSCPTLCNRMDYSPPHSSIHGIFQARMLEWVAISYSRESSRPRDQTRASCFSCTGRRVLYHLHHLVNRSIFIISIKFLLCNFVLM